MSVFTAQAEQAEAVSAAAAEMIERRGLPSLHSLTPADEALRVMSVSNLFDPSEVLLLCRAVVMLLNRRRPTRTVPANHGE